MRTLLRVCGKSNDAAADIIGDSDDAGFTLIEVIVSLALFVVASTIAAYGIMANQHSSLLTQQRVRGANLAHQYLSQVQPGLPLPTGLPTSGTTTSDGYYVSMNLDPADTCSQGSTRNVSVVVRAPHAAATAAPVARADGIVSC